MSKEQWEDVPVIKEDEDFPVIKEDEDREEVDALPIEAVTIVEKKGVEMKIKDISPRTFKKVKDTSPRNPPTDPKIIEEAFGARRVMSTEGMDPIQVRDAMTEVLTPTK